VPYYKTIIIAEKSMIATLAGTMYSRQSNGFQLFRPADSRLLRLTKKEGYATITWPTLQKNKW